MGRIAEILGPAGALSRALPGYESRTSQLAMAEEIAAALASRRPLIVEAGTGTGKTLAYLVPAILSGQKVIVSTGTKNLQEQLFRKDVPLLREHLGVPFEAACIKGLSNYLCLRKWNDVVTRAASRGALGEELEALVEWRSRTETGDRAELATLEDDAEIWADVSPSVESRLGGRCPHFEECFVTRARRRAAAADLVIVNHHLFFADLALRSSWPGAQLLPSYEAVIFDEAHQIEDIATDFFSRGVSSLRTQALVRDLERAIARTHAPARLDGATARVAATAHELFRAMGARLRAGRSGDVRGPLDRSAWDAEAEGCAHRLDAALEEVESGLQAGSAQELEDAGKDAEALARRARALRDDLALIVEGAQRFDASHVFWGETRGRTVLCHASPIDVSDTLRQRLLGEVEAVVFTSATLTTDGSFEFVRARLGLESAAEARYASPFDYGRQALLYLPEDLPDPRDTGFIVPATERMLDLVEVTDGRAFLLFTSHRQMRRAHDLLAQRLGASGRRVMVQGSRPKHLLVEEFRRDLGSVLFATSSFWEGVDVMGEALSLVVIDKLPFAPPDDPLVAARARRLEELGQEPFMTYHVPRAALALAQGFGRLIRHRGDRGIVALLDSRAARRSYGRKVLASLPPDCQRTGSLDEVRAFWSRVRAEAKAS